MSAAIPGTPTHRTLPDAPAGGPGRVIRLRSARPYDPRDGQIVRLRQQVALLARHYADDVAQLQDSLARAHAAERHARVIAVRAEERASRAELAASRWRGEVARATAFAVREAARRERLEEVTELPWWAFKRRRELLEQANPFFRPS